MLRIGTLAAVLLFAGSAAAAEWEKIGDEDGIQAWQREVAGTSLVEFRGQGVVHAPMIQVAAVVRDDDRDTEWMDSCSQSYTVRWASALRAISYNRTESPVFLISDRDCVLDVVGSAIPEKKQVRVDFHTVVDKSTPPVDGVVRMPKVDGAWILTEVDAHSTMVVYEINADPGGSLPHWLVNWANKELPINTIKALREQVKKPGYEKHRQVLETAIDWSSFACCAANTSAEASR
jgi:hypothetical protein